MNPSTTAALIKAAREMLDANAAFDQFGITEGRRQAMRDLKEALAAIEQQPTGGGEDDKWADVHLRVYKASRHPTKR